MGRAVSHGGRGVVPPAAADGRPAYGVHWIDSYNATDDLNPQPGGAEGDLVPEPLRPGRDRDVLGPGEHPFSTRYAVRVSNLAIEPSIDLDALVQDFVMFGGRIVIRKFDSPRDLATVGLQIAARRCRIGVARARGLVRPPLLLVRLRAGEGVAHDVLDARPRQRMAPRRLLYAASTRPQVLGVLAERERDARHGAPEEQFGRAHGAPPQLDDRIGAADGVGAAVQHVGHRQATREDTVYWRTR